MIQTWASHMEYQTLTEMGTGVPQRLAKAPRFRPLSIIFLIKANMPMNSMVPSGLRL